MISKKSVLLIQNNIKSLSQITQACINCGVSEKNIFSVTETESAERYLEIAGISYVIIDAGLYNYAVESVINKFSDYFPITVIVNNCEESQKTLRMMSNKNLLFMDDIEELGSLLNNRANVYALHSKAI